MQIWVVFSIANLYDQPSNNLEAWWFSKPTFEQLVQVVSSPKDSEDLQKKKVEALLKDNILDLGGIEYRLELISEGMVW